MKNILKATSLVVLALSSVNAAAGDVGYNFQTTTSLGTARSKAHVLQQEVIRLRAAPGVDAGTDIAALITSRNDGDLVAFVNWAKGSVVTKVANYLDDCLAGAGNFLDGAVAVTGVAVAGPNFVPESVTKAHFLASLTALINSFTEANMIGANYLGHAHDVALDVAIPAAIDSKVVSGYRVALLADMAAIVEAWVDANSGIAGGANMILGPVAHLGGAAAHGGTLPAGQTRDDFKAGLTSAIID